MPRKKKVAQPEIPQQTIEVQAAKAATLDPAMIEALKALGLVFSDAITKSRPVEKKNFATRKPRSPWDPTDGSPKLKLKRKMYQHGILIDPDFNDNATIDALNHLKVGRYLGDWVKVYKRKDQGIDIDYPVKTASQRMKLPGMGITEQRDPATNKLIKSGLQIFVERMIEEGKRPKQELPTDDDE